MFDSSAQEQLGYYVYGLLDPRENNSTKPFYIGKGKGNRVFSHAQGVHDEIKTIEDESGALSAKESLIAEIIKEGHAVLHIIFRYGLSEDEAFSLEAAIIDIVDYMHPGTLTNIQGGHGRQQGIMTVAELLRILNTKPVNPSKAYPIVFLFPIHKALRAGSTVYDATRSSWRVSPVQQGYKDAIGVGLDGGIEKGSFSIDAWHPVSGTNRHEFTGTAIPDFSNTNFGAILNRAMGYWQRGNFLVVEFNEKGEFRYVKGSSDKTTWHKL
ncbi:MAG: LEM-3-like GIY-YIG domain-containing protein [Candidatus Kapaibacteriota bacterium]